MTNAMAETRNTWWAPVWCGLVADPEGKHVKRLKAAGWLLLYLILHARRATGVVISRRSTIARRMGVSLRTVQRWLVDLESKGYVEIVAERPVLTVRIQRWKRPLPARHA